MIIKTLHFVSIVDIRLSIIYNCFFVCMYVYKQCAVHFTVQLQTHLWIITGRVQDFFSIKVSKILYEKYSSLYSKTNRFNLIYFSSLGVWYIQTTVGFGADLRSLFLRIIKKTIPFKIPPMFENEVTSRKIPKGTVWAAIIQIPYAAPAHHWMKNTNTNIDIFLAAWVDFLSEFAFSPIEPVWRKLWKYQAH